MQNKQAIIGIVAATVILLGAGLVFSLNKNKTSQPNNTTASAKSSQSGNTTQATIAGIFSTKENRKCDFDSKTANSETKGSVYVSGNNAYGTFTMSSSSKEQDMYLVRNGDTFYVWGSGLPQGMKMNMSVDQMAKQMASSQYSNFDPNQKTNFNCVGWTVDNSLFTPPANIKFLELGSVAAPTGTKVAGSSTQPTPNCSLCNSMTGEARTACLSGLHCTK